MCITTQYHLSPPKQEPLPTKVTKGWPGEGETSIIPPPPPDEELPSWRVPFTGDTGASHTCADTRLPRGPAFAPTPNCTHSRNVARFNARDSKASGTQWEGRARTSCSVKQAKKPRTSSADGGWGEEDVEFSFFFLFFCVYSRQLDNNKGAMWINTMAELMVHSAYFIAGAHPRSSCSSPSDPSACHL